MTDMEADRLAGLYRAYCPELCRVLDEVTMAPPAYTLAPALWYELARMLCEMLYALREGITADPDRAAQWLRDRPRFRCRTCRLWLAVWAHWRVDVPTADDVAARVDTVSRRAAGDRMARLWLDLDRAAAIENEYRSIEDYSP